ncbi:UNVERIFIED_CONTAM: hypothetical protein Sradi_4099800 [Sesamum radiatum]|uniref:Uncharacterized protein n=1 Tax=Sesamum radiatum TaxID=300843 RepID=A0AAW2P489_SESRA
MAQAAKYKYGGCQASKRKERRNIWYHPGSEGRTRDIPDPHQWDDSPRTSLTPASGMTVPGPSSLLIR